MKEKSRSFFAVFQSVCGSSLLLAVMWWITLALERTSTLRPREVTHYNFSLKCLSDAASWFVYNLWCHYKLIRVKIPRPFVVQKGNKLLALAARAEVKATCSSPSLGHKKKKKFINVSEYVILPRSDPPLACLTFKFRNAINTVRAYFKLKTLSMFSNLFCVEIKK